MGQYMAHGIRTTRLLRVNGITTYLYCGSAPRSVLPLTWAGGKAAPSQRSRRSQREGVAPRCAQVVIQHQIDEEIVDQQGSTRINKDQQGSSSFVCWLIRLIIGLFQAFSSHSNHSSITMLGEPDDPPSFARVGLAGDTKDPPEIGSCDASEVRKRALATKCAWHLVVCTCSFGSI